MSGNNSIDSRHRYIFRRVSEIFNIDMLVVEEIGTETSNLNVINRFFEPGTNVSKLFWFKTSKDSNSKSANAGGFASPMDDATDYSEGEYPIPNVASSTQLFQRRNPSAVSNNEGQAIENSLEIESQNADSTAPNDRAEEEVDEENRQQTTSQPNNQQQQQHEKQNFLSSAEIVLRTEADLTLHSNGGCLYFLKLSPSDRISEKNFEQEILFGRVKSDVITELRDRLEYVFLPLLKQHDRNWGFVSDRSNYLHTADVSEFLSSTEKFKASLEDASRSLESGIQLKKPKKKFDIENKPKQFYKAAQRSEIVSAFEG